VGESHLLATTRQSGRHASVLGFSFYNLAIVKK